MGPQRTGLRMPCHWKGWAALAAVAAPTATALFFVEYAANTLGYSDADWLFIPIFLIGWVSIMTIAKRHS